MAGRRSGWIDWDAIGEEAEEDASDLNYDYEWIVPEEDEEEAESSDLRRGGRLGLAGGVRAPTMGVQRGRPGRSGHVLAGGGGPNSMALRNNGVRNPGLAHRVHLIVNRVTAGGNSKLARGRCRLGLSGSRRGPNPVTRWLGLPATQGANENVGRSDAEEDVELEFEGDSNDEGVGTWGALGGNGTLKRKRRWYQLDEKQAVYTMILERIKPGALTRGVSQEVSQLTGIPVRTIQNWWKICKEAGGIHGLENKRAKNCGRKRISFDPEVVKQVDLRKRTTLRDLANELNMAKTTLWRRLQEGLLRRHTNAIKSTLTDDNKVACVRFCLSALDEIFSPEDPTFTEMYNVIHIDEKWFYRSCDSQNYYLAPGEEEPYRSTQSKSFIEKVMFLAAVARPRYDANGTMIFDGKLGIWPFTYKEAAKRKSKYREAGTMVTKVLPAVTKDVSRQYMINFLLPTIREKWPASERGMPIYIQQDNAKTHIPVDDPQFVTAAQAGGWDIRLKCQPPNSPDLNILDLGFFAALESLFHKLSPGSIDHMVRKVQQAFLDSRRFVALQTLESASFSAWSPKHTRMDATRHTGYTITHGGMEELLGHSHTDCMVPTRCCPSCHLDLGLG